MTTLLVQTDHEVTSLRMRPAATGATRLLPSQLFTPCEPDLAETTAILEDLAELPGQQRAVEAIRFGIGIRRRGYNLFVLGPHGVGRTTLVTSILEQHASSQPPAQDCCYVQNFEDSSRPALLMMPAGRGTALRADIEHLTDELRSAVPAVFESEAYRKQRQGIEGELKERREKVVSEIRARAEARGFALVEAATGFLFVPRRGEELLDHEAFHALPEEERDRMKKQMEALGQELIEATRQMPVWESETRARIRTLDREMTTEAIAHLIDALRATYGELPEVVKYLDALQRDVIDHANEFLQHGEEQLTALMALLDDDHTRQRLFRRYRVNVLISHAEAKGAPVVVEDNPTQPHLIGQVDYQAHLGALVTDFNLIKPGALHRANGGYLVLDARKVLLQPFAWETLKRALKTESVRIESLAAMLGLATTSTLNPEPMPLDLKVVLTGDRLLYVLLSMLDPEFEDLFKVAAEFDDRMDRGAEQQQAVARMIATIAKQEKLLPFDGNALASVIEQCARWSGHAQKLSTHVARLADLLREADYWAREAKREVVAAEDVDRAVERGVHRLALLSERISEEIGLGTILIDTEGERVGVVNGISVFPFGNLLFGRPARITASVSPGAGEVVDIEREAKLGGPLHSKGVLILSGFIAGRYAIEFPLSLSARVVFEQSYGGIEGDSASCAELYALLSAISGVPLRQSFAVTGSVNQLGEVQPIGAVNEKIEAFFDVCNKRGLTGQQGVVIPRGNVQHLMLRRDVVEAVRAGQFHIHAVATIDEGLEVLTGIEAGALDRSGDYPPATVNSLVKTRLAVLAHMRTAYQLQMMGGRSDDDR